MKAKQKERGAEERESTHQYQLLGSRNELLHVVVGGLVTERGNDEETFWTVTIRLTNVSEGNDHGVSLRWWTFSGTTESVEVKEEYTRANEATTLAGNALISPFVLEDNGDYVANLRIPKLVRSLSQVAFNPTYMHDGRPVLSRPKDHSFFVVPLGFYPGTPFPPGAHRQGDWVNFTLMNSNSSSPKLYFCSTSGEDSNEDFQVELDPNINRTGDIWHCALKVPESIDAYAVSIPELDPSNGYKVGEKLQADPFGDNVTDVAIPGEGIRTISLLPADDEEELEETFDPEAWEEDTPLMHTLSQAVVLEMDVRKEGEGDDGGDINIFKAVESLAVELEDSGITALAVRGLLNEDTLTSVTSVSESLGSREMKQLVMSLHQMDLELILELDCLKLQSVMRVAHLNEGMAIQSLKECLRFLVSEYHLDGICFLHAEKLAHGEFDVVLDRPAIVEDICNDPALCSTKLIAVPFGGHLLPREGLRGFPHWGRWAEVNCRFTGDVQSLYTGEDESIDLGKVSMRLTGSADLFQAWDNGSFHLFAGRPPSYGLNCPSFWGEAPLSQLQDNAIPTQTDLSIRWSLISSIFVSQGVPVLRLLDLSSENWAEELALVSTLCSFRDKYSHLIQKHNFEDPRDLRWHSMDANVEPPWQKSEPNDPEAVVDLSVVPAEEQQTPALFTEESKFIGMSVWSDNGLEAVYAGFNGNDTSIAVTLPDPQIGCKWYVLLDSGRIELSSTNEKVTASPEYVMKPKSSLILAMRLVEENIIQSK